MGRKSVFLSTEVERAIDRRGGNQSKVLRNIVERYVKLSEHFSPLPQLTDDEKKLVLEALEGKNLSGAAIMQGVVVKLIEDAMQKGLDQKWRINKEAMMRKLYGLNFAAEMAMLDAAEIYWEQRERDGNSKNT